jgi:hypothetical protein
MGGWRLIGLCGKPVKSLPSRTVSVRPPHLRRLILLPNPINTARTTTAQTSATIPFVNKSIEMDRLQVTQLNLGRDSDPENPICVHRRSAFIGGSVFLGGPGGKSKISTADERR